MTAGDQAPDQEFTARAPQLSFALSRWLFLRLVGLSYFCAFASLAFQYEGLYGSHGILPVKDYLLQVQNAFGWQGPLVLPSLFWLDASDGMLAAVVYAGVLLSLVVTAGVATVPALIGSWLLYLSYMNVGQEFLSFQWDSLLLETGFLAIFFAPWQLFSPPFAHTGTRTETKPSPLLRWLIWLLLFKLMFGSGTCKLASHDQTWLGLTALEYHYFTQPIPNPVSWFAHHLPNPIQMFSTALMFIVEGLAPFGIFAGRIGRLVTAASTIALMLLIILTGNYAFFNVLTIALAVTLVDDNMLLRLCPRLEKLSVQESLVPLPAVQRVWTMLGATIVIICAGTDALVRVGLRDLVPPPARAINSLLDPLHVSGQYGLFAVMTTRRMEIIVEGSHDGKTWLAYEFPFKPGDLHRVPPQVAPHQPRLDWQMWFAALGPAEQSPWFANFLSRLLQGEPSVLRLLSHDPFAGKPPKFVRARSYDYEFSSPDMLFKRGLWWQRKNEGLFYPSVKLMH